jgi:hypothetical protein
MNRTRRILWITLILAAMLIPTAMAFAKELTSINITGPGISGTLTLDNTDNLLDLQEGGFFDSTKHISRLTDDEITALGEGYHMSMYMEMGEPEPQLVQEMIYYADPAGEAGYIHWLDRGDAEIKLVQSDRWTRVASGEEMFQSMMLEAGVDVKAAALPAPVVVEQPAAANPAVQPEVQQAAAVNPAPQPEVQSAPTPAAMPWGWIGGSAALIALLVGVWFLRQRATPKLEAASASQD